ncbi:MAG: 50S ribosomal protein L6 [Rickettsiales bacterium]
MSRVGKLPVAIPSGVTIDVKPDRLVVKGKGGELSTVVTGDVTVTVEGGQVVVKPANNSKRARAMWGTVRANLNNLVKGVTEGFTRNLEINGVGYRAAVQGDVLNLSLGYSHEIRYMIPKGIKIAVDKQTALAISGIDRQRVGQVAAEIRALRGPEPYKGKGVKYSDERILRKEGKKK